MSVARTYAGHLTFSISPKALVYTKHGADRALQRGSTGPKAVGNWRVVATKLTDQGNVSYTLRQPLRGGKFQILVVVHQGIEFKVITTWIE